MGVKNILRVHDSIGKCFENDLCKLCGCNFWSQPFGDEMRLKQQLAFFYAKISKPSRALGQGKRTSCQAKRTSTMSQGPQLCPSLGVWCHAVTCCDLS